MPMGSHAPMFPVAAPIAMPNPAPIANPTPVIFALRFITSPQSWGAPFLAFFARSGEVSPVYLVAFRSEHRSADDQADHDADGQPCSTASENDGHRRTNADSQRDSEPDLHGWSFH